MADPSQGEIWMVSLDPVQGRERRGTRPALVVSDDRFNHGPADLIVVLPLTSKDNGIPLQVRLEPGLSGLQVPSFAKPEDIRSISKSRLTRQLGLASREAMLEVKDRLRILLDL